MLPQLKKEQLKVGMKVQLDQLSNIFYTYILLSNTELALDENGLPSIIEGTIEFVGDKNEEYAKVKSRGGIMVVMNTQYD